MQSLPALAALAVSPRQPLRGWMRSLSVLCLSLLFACMTTVARAADVYPSRPITLVVPFSAGGDADIAGRNLAVHLRHVIPQPLVVVNRSGAGGAIGSQTVRDAAPDGTTLLLARVGSQAVLPALQPGIGYRWDDFTMLGLLETQPMVCVVNANSPYRTLADLLQDLRARPGQLNYSTSGPTTLLNLAAQALLSAAGLPRDAAAEIPYKGSADATTAVLAGEVHFSCNNTPSLVGPIKSGRLRALVTTATERMRDLPDTPTAREAGLPLLESLTGWSALYGPKGLRAEVVQSWGQALAILAKNAQWRAVVEQTGSMPRVLSPAETHTFVAAQVRFFETLGKAIGLVTR